MLLQRHILIPWLFSAVAMYALSYVWHGLFLKDLDEIGFPLPAYFILSGVAYLIIGIGITLATHHAIAREWISLKGPFPAKAMVVGLLFGVVVYLILFITGMSFAKLDPVHFLADLIWQMFEQAMGGLAVSLGIIYDLHKSFMEQERAN